MIFRLIAVLGILSLQNCLVKNNKEVLANRVVTDLFDSVGNMESRVIQYRDLSRPDTVIHYWRNGQPKDVIEQRNGKNDGWYASYDSVGRISGRYFFVKNYQKGKSYKYYPDGNIMSEVEMFNDKLTGSRYDYDTLGKLDRYGLNDWEQRLKYIKQYDDEGNVVKESGPVIPQYILEKLENAFSVNEDIRIRILVAGPPHTLRQVVVKSQTKGTLSEVNDSAPTPLYLYETKFDSPGTYRIVFQATLLDTINNTTTVDSLVVPIIVSN